MSRGGEGAITWTRLDGFEVAGIRSVTVAATDSCGAATVTFASVVAGGASAQRLVPQQSWLIGSPSLSERSWWHDMPTQAPSAASTGIAALPRSSSNIPMQATRELLDIDDELNPCVRNFMPVG